MEYRPVSATQADEYERIRHYAFHPDDGPYRDGSVDQSSPGTRYGLFADGDLRSICRQYTFDARLRDEWIDLGGLGTVATPPEHRRQGYARRLLRDAVRTYAEQSVPLVALWPFDTAFYRQFGWTTANRITTYECDPAVLESVDHSKGTFRPVDPDDWRTLRDVHLAAGDGQTLSIERTEAWWRRRIFARWNDQSRHVYRYDRGGTPAGYVVHTVSDDRLDVAYLAAVDHDAYRAVLAFLGTHGAQIDQLSFERPGEPVLFDLVDDPGSIECTVRPGPMIRVTDLTNALETVPYQEGLNETITLAVRDPLVGRTDDTVRLAVSGGDGDVSRNPNADPDVTLGIDVLSSLLVGATDVSTAVGHDQMDVRRSTGRDVLDRLFPQADVFLREFF
ncbi:MAG: enhanced intracellular survival protein Eis [Halorhabdus sp.]